MWKKDILGTKLWQDSSMAMGVGADMALLLNMCFLEVTQHASPEHIRRDGCKAEDLLSKKEL